ncbi:cysteine desulfurase family protein [Mesorhizobium sp. 1B3]|uniref:cysteine desulfurase family protein n=1 Tax=Mesorhizobium sp. 1B3 TaxID=3243599 RepID=UPI003D95C935
MAADRAYLDFNASAPLTADARAAVADALSMPANPSSVHSEGRAARRLIEEARREVAALVAAKPEHVFLTSGATEAATTLLSPDWQMGRGALRMARLYVSAADHPCILGGGRFAPDQVEVIGVDRQGVVDLGALRTALGHHERSAGLPLVAIHAANNETGVIQPVAEVSKVVREAGGVLVLDAVQAAGRIPLDITRTCGDYLIVSSHKIGGPKGAGAIVAAADLMMPKPLITGGGQEKGHRAGTENLAAIAGFGAAAREAREGLGRMGEVRALRDEIEAFLAASDPGIEIFGSGAERLPNTTFFSIPGLKAETVQIAFDLAGVALSAGSACSSGKVGASHVLKAMGRGDQAGALRLSIGLSTTREEIALFKSALDGILARRSGRERAA